MITIKQRTFSFIRSLEFMTRIDFFTTKLLKHITAIQRLLFVSLCNKQNGANWSDLELEFPLRLKEVLKSF